MTSFDLTEALAVARNAADAGAAVAMEGRTPGHALHIRAKHRADFVTDVDTAAQAAILSVIRSRYPDHRFLAEEEGADGLGDPSSPYRWIIDPLDGTTPYIHGKNFFGTIVALQENDRTIVGAMTLPVIGQRFWGARGMGAFFNGKPVQLRKTENLESAILCTNMNPNAVCDAEGVMRVCAPRCSSLQNYGCAAHEFGDILAGENDGHFFNGIRIWDGAAACLLIEEAGGRATFALSNPDDPRSYIRGVASTAPIFEELQTFVREHLPVV